MPAAVGAAVGPACTSLLPAEATVSHAALPGAAPQGDQEGKSRQAGGGGGRRFEGKPLDSKEAPNSRASQQDGQKTGGTGDKVGRAGKYACMCLPRAGYKSGLKGRARSFLLLGLSLVPSRCWRLGPLLAPTSCPPSCLCLQAGLGSYQPPHQTGREAKEFEEVKRPTSS